MNHLKAVFWDYPDLADKDILETRLRRESNSGLHLWIMRRFLEYGRVIDVFHYFKMDEIARSFSKLQLTSYTLKKWKRLIEVYGDPERR